MSVQTVSTLFQKCNDILSYRFNIFGFSVNMWAFIVFDVLVFNVLQWILELFRKQ